MAGPPFDYEYVESQVRIRCQDPSTSSRPLLSEADIQSCIKSAIVLFSLDLPASYIAEFAGTEDQSFLLSTTLPSYLEGFSSITAINYPARAITVDEEPVMLNFETDWNIRDVVTATLRTQYLSFKNFTPHTTELIRVFYTGFHTLEDFEGSTFSTFPVVYRDAFCDLVASLALSLLSIMNSGQSSPTFGADIVNHGQIPDQYTSKSKMYMERYTTAISAGRNFSDAYVSPSADIWLNWGTTMKHGEPWIFHNIYPRHT